MINSVWQGNLSKKWKYVWQKYTGMPNSTESNTIAVGDDIYIIGGYNTTRTVRYNTTSGETTILTPMPAARAGVGIAHHDGKIYCFGGRPQANVAFFTNTYIYDTATDLWTEGAPIPIAKCRCACVVYNGLIYCIAGHVSMGTNTNTNYAYDPNSNTWITKTPATYGGGIGSAVLIGNKLHIIGIYAQTSVPISAHQMYDMDADTWELSTIFPNARSYSAGCLFQGKIHCIGGSGSRLMNIYNPASDTWTLGDSLPESTVPIDKISVIKGEIYAFSATAGIMYKYARV